MKTISTALEGQLQSISDLLDIGHPPALLQSRLLELELTFNRLRFYLSDPGEAPYGRQVIFRSPACECIVMNWSYDQDSLPHNHADAEGWMVVVSGYARNVYYDESLSVVSEEIIRPGQMFFLPKGVIHKMGNASNATLRPLVTFHLYAPPISGMQVFDLSAQKAFVVSDDCGAWVPADSQILQVSNL